VNLDPERYAFLKDAGTSRMQKMIDYISQDDVCRSSYLLEYFGQSESSDCGTCDVCRAKTTSSQESSLENALTSYINITKSGKYTIDDIKKKFTSSPVNSVDEVISVLRVLVDKSIVPPPLN
jgi:ATP-dependent DNA helicase RecQ